MWHTSVAGIDGDCFQAGHLLKQGTVLLVIDNTVQLHIVGLLYKKAVKVYELFRGDNILYPCVFYILTEQAEDGNENGQEK